MTAVPLSVLAAFNLVCTGTLQSGELKGLQPLRDYGAFTTIYRVNLETNRYCKDACEQTAPIASVSDTAIVFQKEDDGKGNDTIEVVNRESGNYALRIRFLPEVILREGTCARAPFTGFPVRKF